MEEEAKRLRAGQLVIPDATDKDLAATVAATFAKMLYGENDGDRDIRNAMNAACALAILTRQPRLKQINAILVSLELAARKVMAEMPGGVSEEKLMQIASYIDEHTTERGSVFFVPARF